MASKRGRPKTQEKLIVLWAEKVFQHIPSVEEEGFEGFLPGKDLAELAGLTLYQVRLAVKYLRRNFPENPLVSNRRGYAWTYVPKHTTAYVGKKVKTLTTTARDTITSVVLPCIKKARPQDVARVTRYMDRLIEEIEDLMTV